MDSFQFNKAAGAVLGTALFVMAVTIVSDMIYKPAGGEKTTHVAAGAKEPEHGPAAGAPAAAAGAAVAAAGAHGAAAADSVQAIAVRLASADVTAGETIGKKCLACHSLLKDQPAKVGPNLWNVVGGPAARMATFKYSEPMLAEKAKGFTWTYDHLDKFLTAPKVEIPGTTMGFAGLPEPKERADIIAYLRTLSDNPIPLPGAAAATPTGPAAVAPNPNAPPRSTPLPPPAGGSPATTP